MEMRHLAQQVAAFHNFTTDPEVNVIVLRAVDSTGWGPSLQAAKDAGKVVVLDDRSIDASQALYTTRVASDLVAEGQKAGTDMCTLLESSATKNIVVLTGDPSAPAAIDRSAGFNPISSGCGITITHSENANWSRDEGKQVMADILSSDTNIQGVFAENDEMGLGAIAAIREAGLTPGVDIKIVSIDGEHDAFLALIAGDLNVSVECSPMMAPEVYDAALRALNDQTLPPWIASHDNEFFATQGPAELEAILATRKY